MKRHQMKKRGKEKDLKTERQKEGLTEIVRKLKR